MRSTNFSLLLAFTATVSAFPQYGSLAGLSTEQVNEAARDFPFIPGAQPAPPPRTDFSSKLVFDEAHPFKPLRLGDIRGPCPGLNTLASHGWLDRSGIVTPAEIINAVQDAFNMKHDLATFVTYGAFIVDGNHLTNLMSIGRKSLFTGLEPPPAIIGGLNTHGVFEGDASTTRGDDAFGDNFSFNETLFQQLVGTCAEVSNGVYNPTSAAIIRHNRIVDSQARNPVFDLTSPRHFTVYAESVFPFSYFASGQDVNNTKPLSMEDARLFFDKHTFPVGFKRREGAFGFAEIAAPITAMLRAFPTRPGRNNGAGNFTVDPNDPGLGQPGLCYIYRKQVGSVMPSLYPNPQGLLRTAIKKNIATFHDVLFPPGTPAGAACPQIFPYGQ